MAVSNTPPSARLTLHEQAALARAPRKPQQQWWNIPAKYEAAKRIKGEVLESYPGRNDAGDAMRHAELSRRMATEIDPVTSTLAGLFHEIDNSIPEKYVQAMPPGPLRRHARENWWGPNDAERDMDLHNNREGLRAAREGRAVNPANLRLAPAPTPTPPLLGPSRYERQR
jgi:hypothetical protein